MPTLTLTPTPGHPSFRASGEAVVLDVLAGTNVLDAASANGVLIPTRCGGETACRTCQIEAEEQPGLTPVEADERYALDDERAPAGRRLACQARVVGDARVTLIDPRLVGGEE
jgi:2Fe-2S ferredoxin